LALGYTAQALTVSPSFTCGEPRKAAPDKSEVKMPEPRTVGTRVVFQICTSIGLNPQAKFVPNFPSRICDKAHEEPTLQEHRAQASVLLG
jgi:hypothetical protein